MSWTELEKAADAAEDVYRFIVGIPERVRKAQRRKANPLTEAGFTSFVKDLTGSLLEDTRGEEHAALKSIQHAIDVDWPGFNTAKRNAAITKIAGALGGVPDIVIPKITKTFKDAGEDMAVSTRAAVRGTYKLPIQVGFTEVDKIVIDHAATSQALYIRNAYGVREEQLSKVARSVVSEGLEHGFDKFTIAADLEAALKGTTAARSLGYYTQIASIFSCRARSHSTLSSFQEAGITSYVISAALTEVTCDACHFLNGKVFSVGASMQRALDVASSEDPEDVVELQPFVTKYVDSEGNAALGVGKGKDRTMIARVVESAVGEKDSTGKFSHEASTAQLEKLGCTSPPFHSHCYCTLEPHFEEGSSHAEPSPAKMPPAPAAGAGRVLPYGPGAVVLPPTGGKVYTSEELAALTRPLPTAQAVVEEPSPVPAKLIPSKLPTKAQKEKALQILAQFKPDPEGIDDDVKTYMATMGGDVPWATKGGWAEAGKKPPSEKGAVKVSDLVLMSAGINQSDVENAVKVFAPANTSLSGYKFQGKFYVVNGSKEAVAANIFNSLAPKKDLVIQANITDLDAAGFKPNTDVGPNSPAAKLPKPPTKAQAALAAAYAEKAKTEAILAAAAEKAKHEAEFAKAVADLEAEKKAKEEAAAKLAAEKLLQHPSPATHGAPAAAPTAGDSVDAATILGTKTGAAAGSNAGGFYTGTDGVKRYVKEYEDPSQAHCEHLTNNIYRDLGHVAPVSTVAAGPGGKVIYASEIFEGAQTLKQAGLTEDRAKAFAKGFVADVLTANWDAIGTGFDNAMVLKDGSIARIDNGGSLLFRAKAGRKPTGLLNEIPEWEGFFSAGKNPYYAQAMAAAGITGPDDMKAHVMSEIQKVIALRDQHGGWSNYIRAHAPQMAVEDRVVAAKMLYQRSELLSAQLAEMSRPPPPKPVPGEARYLAKQYSTVTPRSGLRIDELPTSRVIEDHYGKQSTERPTATYSGEKINDYLKRIREATKSIDPDARNAIGSFTGSGYIDIRQSEESGRPNARSNAIQKAFLKATPEPGTVFRALHGLSRDTIRNHLESDVVKLGKNNTDATSSTSWNINSSIDSFMGGRGDHAGSDQYKLLYVLKQKTGIPVEHMGISHEHEVLMKRDAKFRITGLSRAQGTDRVLIVEAEEIVDGEAAGSTASPKRRASAKPKEEETSDTTKEKALKILGKLPVDSFGAVDTHMHTAPIGKEKPWNGAEATEAKPMQVKVKDLALISHGADAPSVQNAIADFDPEKKGIFGVKLDGKVYVMSGKNHAVAAHLINEASAKKDMTIAMDVSDLDAIGFKGNPKAPPSTPAKPLPGAAEDEASPKVTKAPTKAQKEKAIAVLAEMQPETHKDAIAGEIQTHMHTAGSDYPWTPTSLPDSKTVPVKVSDLAMIAHGVDPNDVKSAIENFSPTGQHGYGVKFGGKVYIIGGAEHAVAANILNSTSGKGDMMVNVKLADLDAIGVEANPFASPTTPAKPLPKPKKKSE